MWPADDMRRWMAILAGLACFMMTLLGPVVVSSAQEDWLEAMMNAVRLEQLNEGPFWGTYEPYVVQLDVVRAYYLSGDTASVYAAMNRFMDMLEKRVNGIPDANADWLFDYCYAVTPARYHDVSRHIEKFMQHQFGWPVQPVG